MAELGQYLFAVTRGLDAAELKGVHGLRGASLRVLEHRGLQAITCSVDLDEFGEEPLRRHLESLPWLEEVARAHDAVVQAVAALGPTAPLRLVTICADESSARGRLEDWFEGLQTALDRIDGCHEWSVKAFAPQSDVSAPTPSRDRPASGAAYLERKRARALDRRSAEDASIALAEHLHRELGSVARATRRLAPQDPRLTAFPGTMILNGAYLVADADTSTFRDAAEALAVEHPDAGLDVRGPWPAYSFATLD